MQAVVEDGRPAAAGLETGDLIVAVGDQPVARIDDLMTALDADQSTISVQLTVVRGVDERQVTVAFEPADDAVE